MTEEIEEDDSVEGEDEAVAVAAGLVEREAPVVEQESAHCRVDDIVGKAHLANASKVIKRTLQARLII